MSGPLCMCAQKVGKLAAKRVTVSHSACRDEMSQVARVVVAIRALLYFYGLDRGP